MRKQRSGTEKRSFRRFAAAVCAAALCFSAFAAGVSASPRSDINQTYEYEKGGGSAVMTDEKLSQAMTERYDLLIMAAGRDTAQTAVSDEDFSKYLGYVNARLKGGNASYTVSDFLRAALACGAAGKDPSSVGVDDNRNRVDLLYKGLYSRSLASLKKEGTRTVAYALLALDANGVSDAAARAAGSSVTRQDLKAALCESAETLSGQASPDVHTAGLVLSALAPYYKAGEPGAVKAVSALLTKLAAVQNGSGAFQNSCAATAAVVTGLCAVGLDPADNTFLHGDAYAGLLRFQNSDGGFGSAAGGASSSATTSVARVALVAYAVFQNGDVFYDFSGVKHHAPAVVSLPAAAKKDSGSAGKSSSAQSSSKSKNSSSSSSSSSSAANRSANTRSSGGSTANRSGSGSSSGGNTAAAGSVAANAGAAGVTTTQNAAQGTTVAQSVFEGIRGKNDVFVYEGTWNDGERYTISFTGTDITSPMDFNAVISGESAYPEKISAMVSDGEVISFEHRDAFPGRAEAMVTVALADGMYHLYRYDPNADEAALITDLSVTNGVAVFTLAEGGDYFLSAETAKAPTKNVSLDETVNGLVPASVFEEAAADDTDVILNGRTDRGVRYEILFPADGIETPMDFDMRITEETDHWDDISTMAESPLILHFEQEGALPGKASVSFYANLDDSVERGLFLFDPETHSAAYTCPIDVEQGRFSFEIEHCSDYFIAEYTGADTLFADRTNTGFILFGLIVEAVLLLASAGAVLYRRSGGLTPKDRLTGGEAEEDLLLPDDDEPEPELPAETAAEEPTDAAEITEPMEPMAPTEPTEPTEVRRNDESFMPPWRREAAPPAAETETAENERTGQQRENG